MVKLADSKGGSGESATRIFGNEQMGILFSKFQASLIRSGFELEKQIEMAISSEMLITLADLSKLSQEVSLATTPPIQVVVKPARPDPHGSKKFVEADFLIVDNANRLFWLVEVKEGHNFDTKKSDGELESLRSITAWLAQEFPYRTQYFICSFNQERREVIVSGTKNRFTLDHVLTGREFCEKIGIDYDTLRNQRKKDQAENRRYFLTELLKIPQIRQEVGELLKEDGINNE